MNSSREVISFAERVMTLLEQGKFTSTYKYAVLLALIDLSIERHTEMGIPPESITTRQLAEKIIEIYWMQTNPFLSGNKQSKILLQNTGSKDAQAKIISDIATFRDQAKLGTFSPYFAAKYQSKSEFTKLVNSVESTLIRMPLPRLQILGREKREFIYTISWDESIKQGTISSYQRGTSKIFDNLIRFQPNVASYFIQLNGLLRPLIQRAWAMRVAETNDLEEAKLQEFLFLARRVPTIKIRQNLVDLQEGKCFYCDTFFGKGKSSQPQVDHFIPWARLPNDSLANYVIAHGACNLNKRDFLASEKHLKHWHFRNKNPLYERDLRSIAENNNWDAGFDRTSSSAKAIYLNLQDEVELWEGKGIFTPMKKFEIRNIFSYY